MTPYHETFLPIFLLGCLFAGAASVFAGRRRGCLLPTALLGAGVIAFWIALFVGVDLGYRAWQAMADPPGEAFSDAAALGALLLGWFPGAIFCVTIFFGVRGVRRVAGWANFQEASAADASGAAASAGPPVESGNPYQGPRGR
jgi:hypothetical protein